MRTLTILVFGLFNFTLAFGQTYSSIVSDQEIYDFLNWMTSNNRKYEEEPTMKRKHIYYHILRWDTTNFITKDTALINQSVSIDRRYLFQTRRGTDNLFDKQDREFMFEQFTAIKDTVWHSRFSKSKLLKHKKQLRPNRYYYSIPLFSVDKKYVILQRIYYCGSLCAHGGYYVYRRLDDKNWEFITAENTWIS